MSTPDRQVYRPAGPMGDPPSPPPSDPQQVTTFAQQVHLGRSSLWGATRDVQCAGGVQTSSSETCSGVLQKPYAFAKTVNTFTG